MNIQERKEKVMNKKCFILMIVLAVFAGFIGGALSSQFFTIQTAFAEKTLKPQKLVVAEGLELVDEKGKIYAELKLYKNGPELIMYKTPGKPKSGFINLCSKIRISCERIAIVGPGYSGNGLDISATSIKMRHHNRTVEIAGPPLFQLGNP
jgi:hypothetical protein